jgi:hypothetical protein
MDGAPAMSAIDPTIKDLTQILRDRKSLMFILVMPIAFTLLAALRLHKQSA